MKTDIVQNLTSASYGSCVGLTHAPLYASNVGTFANTATNVWTIAGGSTNIVTLNGASNDVTVGVHDSSTFSGAMTNGTSLLVTGGQIFVDYSSLGQHNVIKTTSASVPTVSKTHLFQSYGELASGLTQLAESEDEDWTIEPTVHNAARYVASTLMGQLCPAPKVFSHGPKSVVFNWSEGLYNLYWTISAHKIHMLFSSREKIERQCELDFPELFSRDHSFFELGIIPDMWVQSVAVSGSDDMLGLLR